MSTNGRSSNRRELVNPRLLNVRPSSSSQQTSKSRREVARAGSSNGDTTNPSTGVDQAQRRIEKLAAFRKAVWYLSRGYPQAFVAWKVGVHAQTMKKWSAMVKWSHLGRAGDRTMYRLSARIRRLPPDLRRRLLSALNLSELTETPPARA